jgi:riboflavin biosynthesis pyrimidine reductase
VDEVLLHVAPVLIGDGIRRFSQNGIAGRAGAVRLEKTEGSEAGQITNMRFRFAG